MLDDIGLVAAIRRLTSDLTKHHGVDVDIDVVLDGLHDDTRFVAEIETVVYRVVQEALTNVARHAAASHATVLLAADSARVRAEVVDDGSGFDPPARRPTSLGLAGMAERASLAGGHLEITGRRGAGTTVRLEVPRA